MVGYKEKILVKKRDEEFLNANAIISIWKFLFKSSNRLQFFNQNKSFLYSAFLVTKPAI
jgi:hypothetical protein